MQRYCRHCRQNVKVVRDQILQRDICLICGISMEEAADLPYGTIISGFQIEKKLTHDAAGSVYIASQMNLRRRVKLKVLADSLCEDAGFMENFFREARAVASLNHPAILQTYEAGVTPEGIYFLVYESVEGDTLSSYIAANGRLDSRDALNIALNLAGALKYAWDRRNLCHGGITPESVIITSPSTAKLSGIFLPGAEPRGEDGQNFFIAPEVLRGEPPSARSDMYSLGALLFLMTTGFPHSRFKDIGEACRESGKDITRGGAALLTALLSDSPSGRPAAWRDVISKLEKLLSVEHARKPDELMYVYKRPLRVRLSNPMTLAVCCLIIVFLGMAIINVAYWQNLRRSKLYYPPFKDEQFMQYKYKAHPVKK